jgi:hypothetical protein
MLLVHSSDLACSIIPLGIMSLRGIHYMKKGIITIPLSAFCRYIYIGADKGRILDAKQLWLLCYQRRPESITTDVP